MKYKDYNDYELIYMVRENDDISKDLLFKKYAPVVGKIALNFYNNYKNYGYEYEDFYQEAMLAFDMAITKYDDSKETLFYTFLIICVKRTLLSYTRNISNTKRNIDNNLLVELDDYKLLDEKSDIDNIYNCMELENVIKSFIYNPSLLIIDTSILELRINGFSWKEISILLDLPNSSIYTKFSRIKKKIIIKLRKCMCK